MPKHTAYQKEIANIKQGFDMMMECRNLADLRSWGLFTVASIQSAINFTQRAYGESQTQSIRMEYLSELCKSVDELTEAKKRCFKKAS